MLRVLGTKQNLCSLGTEMWLWVQDPLTAEGPSLWVDGQEVCVHFPSHRKGGAFWDLGGHEPQPRCRSQLGTAGREAAHFGSCWWGETGVCRSLQGSGMCRDRGTALWLVALCRALPTRCVVTALCLVLEEDVHRWALSSPGEWASFAFFTCWTLLCVPCFAFLLQGVFLGAPVPPAAGRQKSPGYNSQSTGADAAQLRDCSPQMPAAQGRVALGTRGRGDTVPAAPACPGLYLPLVPPRGAELGRAGAPQHLPGTHGMLVAAATTQTPKPG